MNNMFRILLLTLICLPAYSQWQTGLIAGSEQDSGLMKPFLLPWVAFESNKWQVELSQANYKWKIANTDLRSGLTLNYGQMKSDLLQGINLQQSLTLPLGLVDFTNQIKIALTDQQNWQSFHVVSGSVPVKVGLVNLSTGIQVKNYEANQTTNRAGYWQFDGQFVTAINDYRIGLSSYLSIEMADKRNMHSRMSLFLVKTW